MNKLLLIIAILLGLASHAYPQGVSYGPKAGGNFSFITSLDKIRLKNTSPEGNVFDIIRNAFHWGAYYEYLLNSRFSIGTELAYTRVGSIYEKLELEMALKLSYISLPVWIMFYPFSPQQGLSLYLGPALNFLWHAAPVNLFSIIQEKHVDPFEWAIVSGVRYLFCFGLGIDLRYSWGLTDIFDFRAPEQRPALLNKIRLTNHCLQLAIGYNLALLAQERE